MLQLLLCLLVVAQLTAFDKVVIWGHKLHTHTHSYIHHAFFRAFQHMGYETYWFDDKDDVEGFDFSDTLFLTEGQVDKRIPVRKDCVYLLHNCHDTKYAPLNFIVFQVYTDAVLNYPSAVKVEPFIYYDVPGRCVYMPWATDLLPHEVDAMKKRLPFNVRKKEIHWIGTVGAGRFGNIEQLNPFIKACKKEGISFKSRMNVDPDEAVRLIQTSYMAPTIVGKWQFDQGYIPCRIFKNISYGKMGITNSKNVYDLFEGKVIYNPDTYQLFFDAKKALAKQTEEEMLALMDFVRDKHTYINRIQTLLEFIQVAGEKEDSKECCR
ncbi:MAG: hypothetical protein KDK48_00905 [Chlamydiia bacterium]|nr:hypothetical protein [Chlamydiia bacterium]